VLLTVYCVVFGSMNCLRSWHWPAGRDHRVHASSTQSTAHFHSTIKCNLSVTVTKNSPWRWPSRVETCRSVLRLMIKLSLCICWWLVFLLTGWFTTLFVPRKWVTVKAVITHSSAASSELWECYVKVCNKAYYWYVWNMKASWRPTPMHKHFSNHEFLFSIMQCNVRSGTVAVSSEIRSFSSVVFCGHWAWTLIFKYRHNKLSHDSELGNLAGKAVSPFLDVIWSGSNWFMAFIEFLAVCKAAPSSWNYWNTVFVSTCGNWIDCFVKRIWNVWT
jgi:hypothetical protein